jgi:hypothetical protein
MIGASCLDRIGDDLLLDDGDNREEAGTVGDGGDMGG